MNIKVKAIATNITAEEIIRAFENELIKTTGYKLASQDKAAIITAIASSTKFDNVELVNVKNETEQDAVEHDNAEQPTDERSIIAANIEQIITFVNETGADVAISLSNLNDSKAVFASAVIDITNYSDKLGSYKVLAFSDLLCANSIVFSASNKVRVYTTRNVQAKVNIDAKDLYNENFELSWN